MAAKYYVATRARTGGWSGFKASLALKVGGQKGSMPTLTLMHEDPAVLFAAVQVTRWSSTLELLAQLEKVVKSVDDTRPRSAQSKAAVSGLRAMREDVFSPMLRDGQVWEAYLLLTEVYEKTYAYLNQDYFALFVEDEWYEESDGSCYDVEVRE